MTPLGTADIVISVVSHGQGSWFKGLMQDLQSPKAPRHLVLTLNLPEPQDWLPGRLDIQVLQNPNPMGFAANHNQAYKQQAAAFFCVVNPDIRLDQLPFDAMMDCMQDPRVGLVVPTVLSPSGGIEDSVRHFPTPWGIVGKLFGADHSALPSTVNQVRTVPWAAGMFMLFRAEAFEAVGGFDEGFHLYYEDVDICARLWQSGWHVVQQPSAKVVHHAQRASRKDWRFFRWHIASMTRFFVKHVWHTRRLERLATEAAFKDTLEAQ
jgi:N-acetylglucosaminyl-diphospho-decaprenol L-rhamnosyltransferase